MTREQKIKVESANSDQVEVAAVALEDMAKLMRNRPPSTITMDIERETYELMGLSMPAQLTAVEIRLEW